MIHLGCGKCGETTVRETWNQAEGATCGRCGTLQYTSVFQAAVGETQGEKAPEKILAEGESSCFFHPQNRAEKGCPNCGRFLCPLCEIRRPGGVLCPGCFENLRKAKSPEMARRFMMHDTLSLLLTTLPMVMVVWPIITTPAAVVYNLITWNKTKSLLPRSPWRKWAVIGVAVLQVALVIGLVILAQRGVLR